MKRKWIAAVGLALAVSVLAGASIAGAAGSSPESPSAQDAGVVEPSAVEGCFANVVCVYVLPGFEFRDPLQDVCGGTSGHSRVGGPWNSARNRCGNKSNFLRRNGNPVACMNPGGERPNPGTFNEVVIPAQFGALC